MPVRIIFRGLVLFKVTEGENGTIVAKLVDAGGAAAPPAGGAVGAGHTHGAASGGGHGGGSGPASVHRHESEVHIYSRAANGDDDYEYGKLTRGSPRPGNIDIRFPGIVPRPVNRADSYDDFCPRLSAIMSDLTEGQLGSTPARHDNQALMDSFVPNTVTVFGGTIRVRQLVSWDAGAFPLPSPGSLGVEVEVPAEVKFLGSNVRGFMAGECIIDVPDAEQADIDGRVAGLPKKIRSGEDRGKHSLRVPPRTIEILVTNFPPQRRNALPWSGHVGLMFRAAGYEPVHLPDAEFSNFTAFANRYDSVALKEDLPMFRDKNGNGFPFPYIEKVSREIRLASMNPAGHVGNDPWNRPLCPQGDE